MRRGAWCAPRPGSWPRDAGAPARARASPAAVSQEGAEVAQHLIRIEPDAHVLDAEHTLTVHERGEGGVVDVATRRLPGEDDVPSRHLPDLGRGAREEGPAGALRPVRRPIRPQNVPLGERSVP